jgi:hypothetical protein
VALLPQGNFALCGERPTLRALDRRKLFEKSLAKTFENKNKFI